MVYYVYVQVGIKKLFQTVIQFGHQNTCFNSKNNESAK
jgi:hypothetical protein